MKNNRTAQARIVFAAQLKAYRLKAGLSLRELGAKIGEQAPNISAIEHGRRRPWRSSEKLELVAECLGLARNSEEWVDFLLLAHGHLWLQS